MSKIDSLRRILGAVRRLPTLDQRAAATDRALEEVRIQVEALSHQVDSLHARLEQADPQAAIDIATGVRDTVRHLSVELTEQANQTSAALAQLSGR